jgi:tetratricopeptide (TPR) repeat protein
MAGYYPEARQQAVAALRSTNNKVIFLYYLSAVLFAMNKTKEAMLYLEKALATSPKHIKKFIQLNPAILQSPQVADLLTRYKKNRPS